MAMSTFASRSRNLSSASCLRCVRWSSRVCSRVHLAPRRAPTTAARRIASTPAMAGIRTCAQDGPESTTMVGTGIIAFAKAVVLIQGGHYTVQELTKFKPGMGDARLTDTPATADRAREGWRFTEAGNATVGLVLGRRLDRVSLAARGRAMARRYGVPTEKPYEGSRVLAWSQSSPRTAAGPLSPSSAR